MPEGGDWKELYRAASEGDLGAVRAALMLGVDPNYQHPEYGTTPLIAAVERGQLEAARLLVEAGADPDVKAQWEDKSAREVASDQGNEAILAMLDGLR